ncbi:t-SNARE affecting a late Golgi compartment protein 2 [Diatrype stigma]|uniref:t-SNARE affecting a late Golgi compartment protein 2 n=1 Tax=Diatrype stigma TaxID=117547 RepID=A0AAN9USF3_9PEZI
MWRDRTNLYISYRQSYAHHPAKKTRYGPGPSSSLGGGGGGGGASSNGRFSIGGGGGRGGASEDQQGLLSGTTRAGDDGFFYDVDDGDAVIEMDVLPPRWADVSDEVTERLGDIARQSQALERLHQKHVLPVFGDDDEDDDDDNDSSAAAARRAEEAEIERLTQAITRGFHDCHRAIQRVERMVRENGAGSNNNSSQMMTRAEETMARNVQISLAARVQEASANFRKKQSAYLKKLRGMSGFGTSSPIPGERSTFTSSALTTPAASYAADPSLLESDADRSYSQSALRQVTTIQPPQYQQQQQQLRNRGKNDAAITQREREIEDIAQGIIELADIFRDLHTMVIDQGTMLDRIDYNVESMAVDVRAADRELGVAAGYQRRTTKRKLILLLLLLIVGAVILLVIKPKRHSGGGGGGDVGAPVPGAGSDSSSGGPGPGIADGAGGIGSDTGQADVG